MRFSWILAAVLATAPLPAFAQTLLLRGAEGEVVTVTAADLQTLPQETLELESHGDTITYTGPLLFELMARAGAPDSAMMHGPAFAKVVRITASDGYQIVLSLGEVDPAMKPTRVIIAPPSSETSESRPAGFRVVVEGDFRPARSLYGVERIDILDLGEDLPRTGSHH